MRFSVPLSALSPVFLVAIAASPLPFFWCWSRVSTTTTSADVPDVPTGGIHLVPVAIAIDRASGSMHDKPHFIDQKWAQLQGNKDSGASTSKEAVLRGFYGITENALEHYGPPAMGCEPDEVVLNVGFVPGAVCSARCNGIASCPTDVPNGVTAIPECALEDLQTGNKYCLLICDPDVDSQSHGIDSGVGQCGDATCQPIGAVGICTYE